ncbi:MAG: ATPase, T2SS/T4P/T4SS family [Thermodesulfobacteriota bacterium]
MSLFLDKKTRIGEMLVQYGKISEDQLERAVVHLGQVPQALGEILVSLGFVSEEDVIEVLALQLGLSLYRQEEDDKFLPISLAKVFHRQHPFALVHRQEQSILVTHDPENSEILNAAEIMLNSTFQMETEEGVVAMPSLFNEILMSSPFELQLATESDIIKLCDVQYDLGLLEQVDDTLVMDEEDVDKLKDMASEAPVIRYVNGLVDTAVEQRASDIHVEPMAEGQIVRFRIDGVLYEHEKPPRSMHSAIISRIKLLAGLDIAERRVPQDGKISLRISGKEIDLRVSTLPTIHGEGVVIRILEKESIILELSELGMPELVEERFQRLIRQPNGMVLVTGPTGSGKTTTLYCALNMINTGNNKIITVEDPVEYQLDGINQIQVRADIGLDFAKGLRAIVRQDPDVIMVGEIRDLETAEIAVQSALTGHLVFSTLHTNDSASAIMRMIDIGVERFLISSSLRGVVAQRLVRCVCPECRASRGRASEHLGHEPPGGDFEIFKGTGCPACAHTGFIGRKGIYEVLEMSNHLSRDVSRGASLEELLTTATIEGFEPMFNDGLEKVRQGVTSLSEVMRVSQEAERAAV